MGPEMIRADGVSATAMAEAILTHMPLDTFVPESAWRMEVVGDPTAVPEVCKEFQTDRFGACRRFRHFDARALCLLRALAQGCLHRRDHGVPALRQPDSEEGRRPPEEVYWG
jgi:hypothetical protein